MEYQSIASRKPGYSFSGPLGDRELLTVAQTEMATGLGKTSIFELMKSGALERVRILNATRITRRSVEALIAAGLAKVGA